MTCHSVGEDNTLRVWNVDDMTEVQSIDLSSEEPFLTCKYLPIARFCNGDKWVVLASITILNFLDLSEEKAVHRIELEDDGPCKSIDTSIVTADILGSVSLIPP